MKKQKTVPQKSKKTSQSKETGKKSPVLKNSVVPSDDVWHDKMTKVEEDALVAKLKKEKSDLQRPIYEAWQSKKITQETFWKKVNKINDDPKYSIISILYKKNIELGLIKKERIQVHNRAEFIKHREWLIKNKCNFEYHSSGNINSIVRNGQELYCADLDGNAGHGHHISNMVKNDINKWLEEHKESLKAYPADYMEQMYCIDNIEKLIGVPLDMIDIDDCYWQTLYKEGYITHETFIKGRRKKEWKVGRNASIGSLAKVKYVTPYVNGVPDLKRRSKIETPKEYQYIRNHIIGKVYRMFERLRVDLGTHFCMFLTDSVVTTHKMRRYVEKYFWYDGYKVKSKPIEFISVDRKEKKVVWIDWSADKKDKYGKVSLGPDGNTIKGQERYCFFANHQIVQNGSLLYSDAEQQEIVTSRTLELRSRIPEPSNPAIVDPSLKVYEKSILIGEEKISLSNPKGEVKTQLTETDEIIKKVLDKNISKIKLPTKRKKQ